MKYDFDTPVNRRNTNSLKWEVAKEDRKSTRLNSSHMA